MRLMITGGAGFLGAAAAEFYLKKGAEVCVIDNYATGRRENLPVHPKLHQVEGSIADAGLVKQAFEEFRPDFVIHSAASYKDPNNWDEDVRTNIDGTCHVLRQSTAFSVKRFIYLQTALCYGRPETRPITIHHPLRPFTSYSITKTAGENFVILSGLSYASLRLANIYGPRHYSGPMPAFYKRLKNGQKCMVVNTRRDFVEIEDFLSLLDRVMQSSAVGCFNVSSGNDVSIPEIYERVARHFGLDPKTMGDVVNPEQDDVASLLLDPSETEKTFQWKACVRLDAGLENLLKWYDVNGVDVFYTHLGVGKKA